jgi:hypothetical protein
MGVEEPHDLHATPVLRSLFFPSKPGNLTLRLERKRPRLQRLATGTVALQSGRFSPAVRDQNPRLAENDSDAHLLLVGFVA